MPEPTHPLKTCPALYPIYPPRSGVVGQRPTPGSPRPEHTNVLLTTRPTLCYY